MPANACPHCGASEIESDSARGISVCTGCGSVLDDHIIVSEVQFEENAAGGANVIGQFVSSEGTKGHGIEGFSGGMFRESRQVTIEKGRKLLQQLGGQLRLNQHCIDTAVNFYKMCLARNMTRGRRLNQVMAACLYIVCRTEGTSHMLLDISDLVRVNVYTLGQTYMQIASALCINIPAIDPCLFIQRFAQKMKLGDKTHEVCMTALRLVSRMQRDWMATGRRPSGLCGAALVVAARMHDINSKVKDVIRVVKLSEATIRKRLLEFGSTASGALTVDQFQTVDLEEERDPPSYIKNRIKAKFAHLDNEKEAAKLSSEIISLQEQIEQALETSGPRKKLRGKWAAYAKAADEADLKRIADGPKSEFVTSQLVTSGSVEERLSAKFVADEIVQTALRGEDTKTNDDSELKAAYSRPTAASLGITQSIAESVSTPQPIDAAEESIELDLTGIDDDDLNKYILSESEVRVKTHIWMSEHGDFLKELQEKEKRKAEEEEERRLKGKEKRKYRKRVRNTTPAQTAGEAMKRMLEEKRISSKINYDVLRSLEQDISGSGDPTEAKLETDELVAAELETTPVTSLTTRKRFNKPNISLGSPTKKPRKAPALSRLKPNTEETPASDKQTDKQTEPEVPEVEVPQETKEVKGVIVESGPVLVESGPVDYEADPEEEEDDYDEDDVQHISAAALMGGGGVEEDDEDYY